MRPYAQGSSVSRESGGEWWAREIDEDGYRGEVEVPVMGRGVQKRGKRY